MLTLFILAIVFLGFMFVINLICAAIVAGDDDEMVPFLLLNTFVMGFGVLVAALGIAKLH